MTVHDDLRPTLRTARHAGNDPASPGAGIPAGDFGYAYDTIGNRFDSTEGGARRDYYASSGTSAPGANRLNQYHNVTNPAMTFTYDGDGNMTDNGGWDYEWNGENRLIHADNYSRSNDLDLPDAIGEIWVSYVYDYMGRRVERHVREYTGGALEETKTRYLYDGWNLVVAFEWDSVSDTFSAGDSYTWGLDLSGTLRGAGGVGGLLTANLSGGDYSYLYDAHGNVGQLIAGDGSVAAQYAYGPFGEMVSSSGSLVSSKANPFAFSTKYQDEHTALLYYGYRYYDASLGRWLSRDPIEERGGVNLYSVKGNDILNDFDVLGLLLFGLIDPSKSPKPKLKCCGGKKMKPWQRCCNGSKIMGARDCCINGNVHPWMPMGICRFGSIRKCVESLCSDEAIDAYNDAFSDKVGDIEDTSTIVGGILGGAGIVTANPVLGLGGFLAGTPALAGAATRRMTYALCRVSAVSACRSDQCCAEKAY